jgi:predicted Fe-S protein YdhL (DUF1289 family)
MLDSMPPSPCVNVCALDQHGYCLGCYRTIQEIAGWSQFSRSEKRSVLDCLARRCATAVRKDGLHLEIDQ